MKKKIYLSLLLVALLTSNGYSESREVHEQRQHDCFENQKKILEAIEKYNSDHSDPMDKLDLEQLTSGGYLSGLASTEPDCSYLGSDLSSDGTVFCSRHGIEAEPEVIKITSDEIIIKVRESEEELRWLADHIPMLGIQLVACEDNVDNYAKGITEKCQPIEETKKYFNGLKNNLNDLNAKLKQAIIDFKYLEENQDKHDLNLPVIKGLLDEMVRELHRISKTVDWIETKIKAIK